jgi:dynein heavy chain, axonemal
MRADPKTVTQSPHVLRLWLHECDRVFADRLVNEEDRSWLRATQTRILKEAFSRSYEELVTTDRLVFGDFMIPSVCPS